MMAACNSNNQQDNPYLHNEDLWELWQQAGVAETTLLNVDFQFLGTNEKSANDFKEFLLKSEYKASVHKEGSKWNIEVTMAPQTWTLEKLDKQAKEFNDLASQFDCVLDGLGAIISPQ